MLIKANAVQVPLANDSVHCCVTSPPYWGLRKYAGRQETLLPDGSVCAYGLEPTIEAYIEHSLVILREVRRVLRDDGTCWWNLGDSYSAGGRGTSEHHIEKMGVGTAMAQKMGPKTPTDGLKPLDLCLIPERVALAAQADGWYVRSMVIWAKPNPMPESVNGWRWERHRVKVRRGKTGRTTMEQPGYSLPESDSPDYTRPSSVAQWSDCPGCEKCHPNDGVVLRKGSWRPTDAYEHIIMLTKTANYFGDAEAVKEAAKDWGTRDRSNTDACTVGVMPDGQPNNGLTNINFAERGRNLRNVWTFPTQPYPEAHFATFPERLPEICIKASTSERGCCPKCGANWARIMRKSGGILGKSWHDHENDSQAGQSQTLKADGGDEPYTVETLGWRPSCVCKAGEPVPCTVLDPFGGSGTTARVALRLNRRAISIDLAYHGLARKRTAEVQPQLMIS